MKKIRLIIIIGAVGFIIACTHENSIEKQVGATHIIMLIL